MSVSKLLKSILCYLLIIVVVLVGGLFWLTANDRAIDYDVDITGVDIPTFDEQTIDFVPSYDQTKTIPFTAGAVIDVDGDGVEELFLTLFDNYGTNFEKYEEWQNYLRTHQPPTLITWGVNDKFFSKPGAEAFARDLKDVEIHFFDGGHFMLEEYAKEVSILIKQFIN